MGKFQDLTGLKFGLFSVIKRGIDRIPLSGKRVTMWICKCDCGNLVSVKADSLKTSHSVSCGCRKIKHGFSHKERLYDTWLNMKRRCYSQTNKRFHQYGGRGIIVCDEWKDDYLSFREWAINSGYEDDLTIDRINVNGNYEPSNCQWATSREQANNTTRNKVIEYKGNSMTMSQWASKLGMSYGTINHRVQRGWNIERIVNTPQREVQNA